VSCLSLTVQGLKWPALSIEGVQRIKRAQVELLSQPLELGANSVGGYVFDTRMTEKLRMRWVEVEGSILWLVRVSLRLECFGRVVRWLEVVTTRHLDVEASDWLQGAMPACWRAQSPSPLALPAALA
jgi:hypothetical protein